MIRDFRVADIYFGDPKDPKDLRPRLVYFGVELEDDEAKLFTQAELGREASSNVRRSSR